MRTTLAIREELLEEFKSMPGAKTKREYSDFDSNIIRSRFRRGKNIERLISGKKSIFAGEGCEPNKKTWDGMDSGLSGFQGLYREDRGDKIGPWS